MMWPCSFKQLWFGDMPLTLFMDNEDPRHSYNLRSGALRYSNLQCEIQQFLEVILACVLIVVNLHDFEVCQRSVQASKSLMLSTQRSDAAVTSISRRVQLPPNVRPKKPTLLNIAPEIRQKILRHVVDDVWMTVVCYERQGKDEFSIKRNDRHSVLLTCRDLYQEGVAIYYDTIDFHVKAVVPGRFSGEMSTFGGPMLRNNIKHVTVGIMDEEPQRRIISSFKNANITFSDERASNSRKGAFYFNS